MGAAAKSGATQAPKGTCRRALLAGAVLQDSKEQESREELSSDMRGGGQGKTAGHRQLF